MSTAYTLVVETSTPEASLALVGPDGAITERRFKSDRSHNSMLFEPLEELLHGGESHRKIELVLVGSGPGSYSGTRVGIAAAQGVAIAFGCPAVALPSILAVPPADHGAPCLAIGDARRGSYWTASIQNFALTHEPALCDAEGLEAAVSDAVNDKQAVFAFESPARFPFPEALKQQVTLESPDAARLWHVWQAADEATRAAWSAAIPQPHYLKPPHITKGKRPSLLK